MMNHTEIPRHTYYIHFKNTISCGISNHHPIIIIYNILFINTSDDDYLSVLNQIYFHFQSYFQLPSMKTKVLSAHLE